MADSLTVSLFLAVAALCSLLLPPSFSSAAAKKTDLAIQVCKNTTDFAFCRDAVYSDPHAPGADRYMLIDIIFRQAYLNATDTRDYIAGEIKSGGGGGLKKCLANYDESIQTLAGVLNDLNSESYYELDIRSRDVEGNVRACEKSLRLRGRSPPLARRNKMMLKFANMCYVVSKLFEYHD